MTTEDIEIEKATPDEIHTIAIFATAIAEALLSVAEQHDVDVASMTFEIQNDEVPEPMPVAQAIQFFKLKLGVKGHATATRTGGNE